MFTPGTRVGSLEILGLIGAGAMGEVYRARDTKLGRDVALKVLPEAFTTDADRLTRFHREAQVLASLNHPNIAAIYGMEDSGETHGLVLELVEGETLAERMARVGPQGGMALDEVVSIASQVVEALRAAHERGVVHRDLKPANIKITSTGAVKLLDFGLAKALAPETDDPDIVEAPTRTSDSTRPGAVMGTLSYMAPEQAGGEAVDARSDLFALGIVLYEMLAGRRPFDGETAAAQIAALLRDPVPPLPRNVPARLVRIVRRCLEKVPGERYQEAREVLVELERVRPDHPPILGRRGRLGAAAGMLTALIGGAVYLGLGQAPAVPVEAPAPVSILVADFENETGNPIFDGALELALTIGLEDASFVATYPRANALVDARTLELGERLDSNTARLVAIRNGVRTVLAGSIRREDERFALGVRVLDAVQGDILSEANASADTSADVLGAISRLALTLRIQLGEQEVDHDRRGGELSISSTSLEALSLYSAAQDLARAGKDEEAIEEYRRALEWDPDLAVAHSGWGLSAYKLGRLEESEARWQRALALVDRVTERERFRLLGLYYTIVTQNYDKAMDNFENLVDRFPADTASRNNLAVLFALMGRFDESLEQSKRILAIYPERTIYRANHGQYALYAGDVPTARDYARSVLETDPSFFKAYLVIAGAALMNGDTSAAEAAYRRMGGTGSRGASLAASGLADMALSQGRTEEGASLLVEAIAADEASGDERGAATKRVALAQTNLAQGRSDAALSLVDSVSSSRGDGVLVPAAEIYAAHGRQEEARVIADELRTQFRPPARAYARLIDARLAHYRGDHVGAVDALRAALGHADLWLVRFYLGQAYLEAGHPVEARAEFDACFERRSEASALFFDDVPTWRYVAWLEEWREQALVP